MYYQMEDIKTRIYMALKVINMYEWLLDLFVLDFFVDNHWDKLPFSWRKSMESMDIKLLGHILLGEPINHMLPLSFLALIKSVQAFSIPRAITSKHTSTNKISELGIGNHSKLQNLFLKHVKLKKRHEINLMAQIVYNTACKSNCQGVIDFGSGLGHLVRVLGYKYKLLAVGIESQAQLTEEARHLDLELEYSARKHVSETTMASLIRPTHLNMTLSHEHLFKLSLPDCIKECGLVGLHPCGDLGPLLLKHFVNSRTVKYICVIGCCYMKLTCNDYKELTCDDESFGYPMSAYMKNLKSKLSYTSREIACHAVEVYSERLIKGNYEDLKIHAFRAALEKVLVDYDPSLKHSPVRSIKHTNNMTFDSYCEAALKRLGPIIPNSMLPAGRSYVLQWRRVLLVYTLRLILAPLVETVVLLDRVLYVLENGLSCEICPVFDPKLSPRNHIIIGRR